MSHKGASGPSAQAKGLAQQVTGEMIFEDAVVVDLINDVTRSMPTFESEFWRDILRQESAARSVKRAAIEAAVTLSLSKAFESEDDFEGVAQSLAEIDYRACQGRIGRFVRKVIELDMRESASGVGLPHGLPQDVLESRYSRLLAIADSGTKAALRQ